MKNSIIASTLFFAVSLAQTTGQLGDAEVVTNNPAGVSYRAVLPNRNTTTIRGSITGTSNEDGTGVMWEVDLTGLPDPSQGGPFLYHLHDQPVPANGNCTATLAHLDPYVRGEIPPCDPSAPQTCQVGDLGGKYGNIPGPGSFQASYLDLYTSTRPGPASFFGNRSVVIHLFNTTRLTCANFQLVDSSSGGNSTNSTGGGSGGSGGGSATPTVSSPPIPTFTGAAVQKFVSGAAVMVGFLAFAL